MIDEERRKLYAAYSECVCSWLELGRVTATIVNHRDKEQVRKGKKIVQNGLDVLLTTLEAL